ncbi:terpenoid synthase [Fomitiporia mediterranea MF3/22]|uniref:terpenoid synthase n=1 Tax=Fomitiporia mediterranea (strain MF3/22) TaxID=694068 RepID=UPI0004408A65|nr:terpenoid synthase [Fomitiporia mediterranea MF3/22]EJC98835.1 terpenoid synthase [Fomitiporia mediterranea MF3/22]
MSNQTKSFYLPDTMATWPWQRAINPYYEQAKAESNAWFHRFKAFSAQSQYAFDKGDFKHLRSACDLMNVFFVIDEYTDVEPEPVVRNMVDIVIDALKNPHKPRPKGEVILGEITRQYWASTIKIASSTSQRHFIESFTGYLESVVQQAADRDNDKQHSIESYLRNRHENIGTRPSYAVIEFNLHLPDEVIYHPIIVELSENITELILIDNDLASYNKEQATGDDSYNIVTVVMRELNLGLDEAIAWVANYHAEVQKRFLNGVQRVPSWGPEIDTHVQRYLNGLGNWARANACWHYESGRYFGSRSPEVLQTRRVQLLPKVQKHNVSLKRENVVVPLIEALESRA